MTHLVFLGLSTMGKAEIMPSVLLPISSIEAGTRGTSPDLQKYTQTLFTYLLKIPVLSVEKKYGKMM